MKIKRSELAALAKKHIGNDSLESQNQIMLKIAVARAARLSYTTLGFNPKIDYEADIKLHDRLMSMKHWSPFEHCARVMSHEEYNKYVRGQTRRNTVFDTQMRRWGHSIPNSTKGWCRNYRGFIQYRHLIET